MSFICGNLTLRVYNIFSGIVFNAYLRFFSFFFVVTISNRFKAEKILYLLNWKCVSLFFLLVFFFFTLLLKLKFKNAYQQEIF